MNFEIDTRKFYLIGVFAFGVMAVMNTATLLQTYKLMILTQLISQIASICFNYALFGFFFWMFKKLPPKNLKPVNDEELEIILKEGVKNTHK